MKAVVAAFNQEKALVGAFTVITNLRMELFEALVDTHVTCHACAGAGVPGRRGGRGAAAAVRGRHGEPRPDRAADTVRARRRGRRHGPAVAARDSATRSVNEI